MTRSIHMRALHRRLIVAAAATATAVAVAASSLESRFALVSAADREGAPMLGLAADDFVVEDGGARCEVLSVTPASYPISIVVDTSSFARSDFQQLRDSVHQFIGALSGRDVALFTTGALPARVVDFTRDLGQLEAGIEHTFAEPGTAPRTLDAIADAARDLREQGGVITRIVVVSAGGPDSSGRSPRAVLDAVVASRSIVDVIDLQQTQRRAHRDDERSAKTVIPSELRSDNDAALLHALSKRTLGIYERIVTSSGYAASLQKIRGQILSEVVVEYAATPGSARKLRVGVRLPNAVVRGIAVERWPDPRP
jgi:VWA domain-containing protein